MLWKAVCPYEYIDDWEKFNETTLFKKEESYSNLNMKDIPNADYIYAKRVEIKNLGEYHDFYLQCDTLLLVDVFKNFRTCQFFNFLSSWIAWQAALKKAKVKSESLTDTNMLLMIEKRIRGGICHAIHQHPKANNEWWK